MGKKHGTLKPFDVGRGETPGVLVALRDFSSRLTDEDSNVISIEIPTFLISKCGDVLGSYEKIARGLGKSIVLHLSCGNGNPILPCPAGEEFSIKGRFLR